MLAEFHERWLYDPYRCNNEGRNAEGLAYKLGLHRVRQFYAGLRESLRSVRILGDVDANGRQMEIALATKDVPVVIYLLEVVDPQRIRFQGTGNTFLMEIIEGFHEDEAIRIIQACFRGCGYNPYMYNNNNLVACACPRGGSGAK
ncbi:MAG: hypothetical protein LBD60_01570 [Puniceicoccales bacterium]|nr:hypothetical protein [Puniceicoccales bacterium]